MSSSKSPVHAYEAAVVANASYFIVCEVKPGLTPGVLGTTRNGYIKTKHECFWPALQDWAEQKASGKRVLLYACESLEEDEGGTSRYVCITTEVMEALRKTAKGAFETQQQNAFAQIRSLRSKTLPHAEAVYHSPTRSPKRK